MKIVLFGILPIVMHIACFAAVELPTKIEKLEGGYSVKVPHDIKTIQDNPMPDFVVYSMIDPRGKIILRIYIGNHPESPTENHEHTLKSSTAINGFATKSKQWTCANSLICGDVYIHLLEGNGWPSAAHLYYRELSENELQTAKNIIDSFAKN